MGEGDEGFWVRLEALAMHDRGAGFVVLLFADPHLLESREGGQDGATNPYGVLTLRRGNHLQDNTHMSPQVQLTPIHSSLH